MVITRANQNRGEFLKMTMRTHYEHERSEQSAGIPVDRDLFKFYICLVEKMARVF